MLVWDFAFTHPMYDKVICGLQCPDINIRNKFYFYFIYLFIPNCVTKCSGN